MMIQRHHRIDEGREPLQAAELLPASGPTLQAMHEVAYSVDFAEVVVVYETMGSNVQALGSGRLGSIRSRWVAGRRG